MPTRTLPPRPSLHQLKIQANELRRAHRDRDVSAAGRIAAHHPEMKGWPPRAVLDKPLALADAQLVIAREYGFRNWSDLKRRIEQVRQIERIKPYPGFDAALAALNDGDVAYLRTVRRLLARVPGAAVILAHHAGWQDNGENPRKRERGSSAFRGNVDATLYLEAGEADATRGEAALVLRTLKVRDGEKLAPLNLIGRRVSLVARTRSAAAWRPCRCTNENSTTANTATSSQPPVQLVPAGETAADLRLPLNTGFLNATVYRELSNDSFAQIVKAPIRWNGDPLVSRAGESAKVIVDVTAAAGQLRSLPAVLLRE